MEISKEIRKKINYDCDSGIFINNFLWKSFGRRIAFLDQYLINRFQESTKKGELINGFAFIPEDEIINYTGFSSFNQTMKYHLLYLKSTGALETESFGTDHEDFYKINIKDFLLNLIPNRLNRNIHTISNSKNHLSKNQRKALKRRKKIEDLEKQIEEIKQSYKGEERR